MPPYPKLTASAPKTPLGHPGTAPRSSRLLTCIIIWWRALRTKLSSWNFAKMSTNWSLGFCGTRNICGKKHNSLVFGLLIWSSYGGGAFNDKFGPIDFFKQTMAEISSSSSTTFSRNLNANQNCRHCDIQEEKLSDLIRQVPIIATRFVPSQKPILVGYRPTSLCRNANRIMWNPPSITNFNG